MKKGAKYKDFTLKAIEKEIHQAETMIAYTKTFDDKTSMRRWKIVSFELKCLYKKLETAFKMMEENKSENEIRKEMKSLNKKLFKDGP